MALGVDLVLNFVRSTHAHSVGGSWTDGVHTVRVVWQGGIRQRVIILFGMIFICRPNNNVGDVAYYSEAHCLHPVGDEDGSDWHETLPK